MPKLAATAPQLDVADLDALIRKALERAPEGLIASKIRSALPKAVRPSPDRLEQRLRALAKNGGVFVWPGRTPRFAAVDFEAFARERILEALRASGALTESELKRKLPSVIGTRAKEMLPRMVAEGSVLRHPPLNKRHRFALQPADPLVYLEAEMEGVLTRLAKLGFDERQRQDALRRYASRSAPAQEEGEEVLAAMQRLNPQASRGALVPLPALRAALHERFPDKTAFDQAVLRLAERGRVQLQSHAWPSSLSAEEKESMIDNGRGGFYEVIGVRLE